MRAALLLVLSLLIPTAAHAEAKPKAPDAEPTLISTPKPPPQPPLGVIELRVAGGMSGGGGAGQMTSQIAPIYLGLYLNVAANASPWTYLRGGLIVEAGSRAGVGASFGPRLLVGKWVIGASGEAILAPYTLYGGAGHLARRLSIAGLTLAPGLQVTAYAGGDDLPDGNVVIQGLLALGVEVDAW